MTARPAIFDAETGRLRRQRVVLVLLAIVSAGTSMVLAPGLAGMLGAGLALVMGVIAAVDAQNFIIPDALSAVGFVLALLQAALHGGEAWAAVLAATLLRAAVVAAMFWLVRLVYRWLRGREGLGFGDVKLAGVAGAWLGWVMIPIAVEIAALAAIAFYLMRQYGRGRRVRASGRLPFGAFFAPAIWLGWVFETVILGKF